MVHPKVEETLDKVDGFMAKYPSITQYERLQELEDKTGQSKVFFFLAGCTLATGILYLTGGSKLLTDLVSFVYPAYMSFKALDSATDTDDKQWLTYWVVFSFVSIFEQCLFFITTLIPFYSFGKVGFFLWLYHPKFLGAQMLYGSTIRPLILPYLPQTPVKKVA